MKEGVNGFGWNSLAQAYKVLFSSVVLIILARLIPVEAFGVLGMSTVFVLFFNTLLNIGFDSSIIYSKTIKQNHLFSLFLMNVATGIVIWCIGYASAPLIASFYGVEEVEVIFKALIFGVILGSFGVVPKGYLQRQLKFKSLAIVDLISITIAGVTAVTFAFMDYGYWALIIQQLFTVGLSSIGYLIISYKNIFKSLMISYSVIKEHFTFGYNILIFNIINFFASQLDVLLVGRLLGERDTGIYMLAFNLVLKPIQLLVQVFNKTLYPILTRLKAEIVSKKYIDYTHSFFFIFSPLIIFGISLSQIVVPYILTDRWNEILLFLVVFGYQSIRTLIASPSGLLFLVAGKPKIQWRYSLFISIPLRVLGITLGYLALKSALGIAVGINILATIEMLVGFYISFKLINLSIYQYLKHFKDELLNIFLLAIILAGVNLLIDFDIVSVLVQSFIFISFIALNKKKINRLKLKLKEIE